MEAPFKADCESHHRRAAGKRAVGRTRLMGLAGGLLLVAITLPCFSCAQRKLEYYRSPSERVIVYRTSQALPPQYVATAPLLVIFGDGRVLRLKGYMDVVQGKIEESAIDSLLRSIDKEGFFGMPDRMGEVLMGRKTKILTVRLKDRQKEVSAQGSTRLDVVIGLLDGLKVQDERPYAPSSIVLFAGKFEGEAPPGSLTVTWKGRKGLLEEASKSKNGLKVSGDDARRAWIQLASAYESVREPQDLSVGRPAREVLFEEDGVFYSNVFALLDE